MGICWFYGFKVPQSINQSYRNAAFIVRVQIGPFADTDRAHSFDHLPNALFEKVLLVFPHESVVVKAETQLIPISVHVHENVRLFLEIVQIELSDERDEFPRLNNTKIIKTPVEFFSNSLCSA